MHYYPHHIGDFIKDTANLNNDQCMAYLRMCWRYYLDEKPITGECEDIAFALGTDEKTVRLLLKHYFIESEDGWRHSRIDREIDAYKNKAEKARKSANARWNNANAMRTHNERNANASKNDANQEPRTNNQERKEKEKKESWNLPKEVNPQIWAEFEQHRKDIRKPLTDQARTKNANILKTLPVDKQRQCVDTTIAQRWTGVFPPKAEPKPKRNGSGTAEDVGRAYQAEFGKPPPPGKTTDEVRAMISQRRDKQTTWCN